jgi:hypothetical protein
MRREVTSAMLRRVLLLALLAGLATARTARPEEPAPPPLDPALLAAIEARGFAVDDRPVRGLAGAYRTSPCPVLVTTDSMFAAWTLLLRRAVGVFGAAVAESLRGWITEWDEAVRQKGAGEAGRIARDYTALLSLFAARPPANLDATRRLALLRRLARIRGELKLAVPEPGEPGAEIDVARLRDYWKDGRTTPSDRFDTAVYWITCADLPATEDGRAALRLLAETLPVKIRDLVSGGCSVTGLARARCPGERTVIALDVPADRRFPMETFPDHAEVFGLDLLARLGSSFARERLAVDPVAASVRPATEPSAAAGSLAEQFEALLARSLSPADPRAPAVFRSPAWHVLSCQSALAAGALFRRALGPFHQPAILAGTWSRSILFHPDPVFFREFEFLSRKTADWIGVEPRSHGRRSDQVVATLSECLKRRLTPPEAEMAALRELGLALPDVEALGTEFDTPELRNRLFDSVVPWMREFLARERSAGRNGLRPVADLLAKLSDLCPRFAAAAEAELSGRPYPEPEDRLLGDWISLLERAQDPRFPGDPFCAAVVALEGLDGTRLIHGCAGLRTLYLRWSNGGEGVLVAGVVLAFRQLVGPYDAGDEAWAGLVEQGLPKVPSWAAAAAPAAPR